MDGCMEFLNAQSARAHCGRWGNPSLRTGEACSTSVDAFTSPTAETRFRPDPSKESG